MSGDRINKMLIFIIQGYEQELPTGDLTNVTTVELIGESYSETLERAKKLIEKKFWRLKSIIEKNANT